MSDTIATHCFTHIKFSSYWFKFKYSISIIQPLIIWRIRYSVFKIFFYKDLSLFFNSISVSSIDYLFHFFYTVKSYNLVFFVFISSLKHSFYNGFKLLTPIYFTISVSQKRALLSRERFGPASFSSFNFSFSIS